MNNKPETFISPDATSREGAFDHLDIDDSLAALFFASVRCACFKQAARSLNTPVLDLRKRLERLEERLGAPLLVYRHNRLVPTRTGQRLAHWLQARRELAEGPPDDLARGPLRIAICEPLLSDIACRDLVGYVRERAQARLSIRPDCDTEALRRGEVDIGVTLGSAATVAGYGTERLGRLGWSLFIASRYGRSGRLPANRDELMDFMLVSSAEARPVVAELLAGHRGGNTRVRSHGLVRSMVLGGACVGVLPSYSRELERNIMVLPGLIDDTRREDINLYFKVERLGESLFDEMLRLMTNSFAERHSWLA